MKKLSLLLSVTFILCVLVAKTQNVGINNTNPQAALDLNGDLRLRTAVLTLPNGLNNDVDLVTNKSSVYMFAGGALAIGGCQITGFTGGVDGRVVTIFNNSVNGAIQLYDANFSVSPSAAANKIVTGTGKNAVIYGSGSVTLRYDGATQKWTVIASHYTDGLSATPSPWLINGNNISNTNTGNIGIGTNTAAAKLDVVGNVKITDGTQGEGKVLTSDANGAATWRSGSGSVGFGTWGDCSMNNISDYNPVVDDNGASGDLFSSVSISGNYAIVGALYANVGANTNQGSASIFQWNGTNWVFMQKITDPTGGAYDYFGASVCISGNYAIVGASDDDVTYTNQGSACIFQFIGGNWVFMQKITDPSGASDDSFGSVSISGNYAVVGSALDNVGANSNQGSVCIFQLIGGNWVFMQKITDATGASGDYFGGSVSISGNYAIVGAYYNDVGANWDQGSASIYQLSGGAWVLMQKITDPAGAANDIFGTSVSISGNYAIVSSLYDDVGVTTDQGSASIYQLSGGTWVFIQKITDPLGEAGNYYGSSVSISGNYAIVGARKDNVGTNYSQGSAFIYQKVGLGWQKLQYVTDPGGNANDNFGASVGIDGNSKRFVIGAFGYANFSGKAVFGKIN